MAGQLRNRPQVVYTRPNLLYPQGEPLKMAISCRFPGYCQTTKLQFPIIQPEPAFLFPDRKKTAQAIGQRQGNTCRSDKDAHNATGWCNLPREEPSGRLIRDRHETNLLSGLMSTTAPPGNPIYRTFYLLFLLRAEYFHHEMN